MTDIGIALEKLIDVLQLEGHELFRIFAEVQGVKAIGDGVILISGFLGLFLGAYLGNRWLNSIENPDNDDVAFIIFVTVVCAILGFILSSLGVHIYMHLNYPEYFAAKELINQISYLT